MYIINLAGMMQNGKDSLADYLKDKLNADKEFKDLWVRAAFANAVKKVFMDTFGVTREFIEEWKVKPEPPPGFDMNVRQALQFIGDGFRKIKSIIWIDLMFRERASKIISDGRYINEIQRVYDEGGLNILIAHPDRINNDPNGSESQIRPYAVWCLENLPGACSSPRDFVKQKLLSDESIFTNNLKLFHLFVRNDKTIQHLYNTADQYVIPAIKTFFKVKYVNEEVLTDPNLTESTKEQVLRELEKYIENLRIHHEKLP